MKLTNPCTLKRSLYIYSTIPVYYCFVHVLERKNYLLNYLEDFETDGSCCFLIKAHGISSFVLSAINFISHLDSNKYTIKKQEEVTKGYFGRVWA